MKKTPNMNIGDPNFSVYVEAQKNSTPPNDDFLQQHINKIYPKPTKEWIDDTIIKKCQNCEYDFGWFTRKHHCRACGGVFCGDCCNIYTRIPNHLIERPDEHTGIKINFTNMIHTWKHDNKSLVCVDCNKKIDKLLKIEWIIKIGEFVDLCDLYTFLRVSRNFHNAGIHWLSKFRNIQYKSMDAYYGDWERNIMWSIKEKLVHHNIWCINIMKSIVTKNIDKTKEQMSELFGLLQNMIKNNKRTISCWSLMCSRKCDSSCDILDILETIQYICKLDNGVNKFWIVPSIRTIFDLLIDRSIERYGTPDLDIMPVLSTTLRIMCSSSINVHDEYVMQFLGKIMNGDTNMIMSLAFESNYLYQKNNSQNSYHSIVTNFINSKLNVDQRKILAGTISTLLTVEKNYSNIMKMNEINERYMPILYPFDTNYSIIEIKKIKELQSNSKPLLVKINIKRHGQTNAKIEQKKIILKKDSNLRKENIVSNLISSLQKKLYNQSLQGRLDKFDMIPTYKILMMNSDVGIIEFVEQSITLGRISSKGYTLKNYIYEHNKYETIRSVNDRFMRSLAISSCLSYLLGLGDRHLDNIMINKKKGQIFHIDYGYLMENPITNILGAPIIRITNEMVDFLGGQNSEFYMDFKNYVIQVFDILRLYSNVILDYYYILGYEKIIDWDQFKRKITNRFLTGLSCKDVEISLIKEIEMSSKSYSAYFIDTCHKYSGILNKSMNSK